LRVCRISALKRVDKHAVQLSDELMRNCCISLHTSIIFSFLRFKSPSKSSVATVNECRRRLELKHLPSDNHADAKKQASFVESPHAGGMDGLLMTAFATNDCLAASEEAAALCSGGFSGIIGSSQVATAFVSAADRAVNSARPPVLLPGYALLIRLATGCNIPCYIYIYIPI